jgi:hypothetical protein
MPPASHVSLPVPEPLALLEATLRFLIQVLIAQQPDLLKLPDEPLPTSSPHPLRAARHVLEVVRELHYALDTYRACLPDKPGYMNAALDDDIPF